MTSKVSDAESTPKRAGGGGKHFEDMEDDIPFASCSLADDPIFRRLRQTHE